MLEKVLRIALLYDCYGALLTEKQQECIEMHYLNDYSLSEIADELSVSRQAVHDNLRRAEQTLEDYEAKLQLAQKYNLQREILKKAQQMLKTSQAVTEDRQVKEALGCIESLLIKEYNK